MRSATWCAARSRPAWTWSPTASRARSPSSPTSRSGCRLRPGRGRDAAAAVLAEGDRRLPGVLPRLHVEVLLGGGAAAGDGLHRPGRYAGQAALAADVANLRAALADPEVAGGVTEAFPAVTAPAASAATRTTPPSRITWPRWPKPCGPSTWRSSRPVSCCRLDRR